LLAGLLADGAPEAPVSELALALEGPRERTLAALVRTCARRGLAASFTDSALTIASLTIPLEAAPGGVRARVRDHRVELDDGKARLGERPELLAAAALLELLESGPGLRWAVLGLIEGHDGWHASVDLCERPSSGSDSKLDAGLARCLPALVGRVAFACARGPQLGAALHLSAQLSPSASVEALRDRLAHARGESLAAEGRWPELCARSGWSSADSLGEARVLVDLDALVSAGPLVRIVAYYDPAAILAGDLLRRACPP
jgi:hypothetical protein